MSSESYSFETGIKKTFHWADYVVLCCILAISGGIGIYYAIKDRNKKNALDEYMLAGRSMHPFPVALSLLSSFISAIMILGKPAEVYVHSTMLWWVSVAFILTAMGAAHIFIPVFYNLGITSVFQYIDMRFGAVTRVICSITYLIWMVFYMAIVMYAPSLALNAVTGLSLWGSVIVISTVCIFYTAMGGMKAVLWADTIQMLIIFIGMSTLLYQGSKVLGGLDKAWNIAEKRGRIVLFELSPDPRMRHSVWSIVIGGAVFWCSIYGTNQAQVQRAISVRSVRRSQLAIWLNLPGLASIVTIVCLVGVIMFAFYADCDPVSFGLVSKADQLVALWMLDLFGDIHGLSGLLLATVFSGSLSTISSGLNAVSAVMLEDFVKPMCSTTISNSRATKLSKGFVVLFGCLSVFFAFVVSHLGTMILQLGYVLFGVLGGPLLGVFTLGMLFPWANKWGGSIGLSSALCLLIWIGVGTTMTKTSVTVNPYLSTAGCNWNITNATTPAPPANADIVTLPPNDINDNYTGIQQLYTISYLWYASIGVVTVCTVGMIVSLLTGATDPKTLNPKLICPWFDIFCPFLPEEWRKTLRFGVRHGEEIEQTLLELEKTENRKNTVENLNVDETSSTNGKFLNGQDNVAHECSTTITPGAGY